MRMLVLLLSLSVFIAVLPSVAVGSVPSAESYAQALEQLEILKGTEEGYELDRIPTRAEALVMLLRLMGEEKAAVSSNCEQPFEDAGWATKYIAYAYQTGVTKGVSEQQFGTMLPVNAAQFSTFVLRALGYEEGEDFTYESATDFAVLALGTEETFLSGQFTRGDMVKMSYLALNTRSKGSWQTMGKQLTDLGVFKARTLSSARNQYEKSSNPSYSTTVLIYMIASDLESLQGRATHDVNEMISAKPQDGCTVLLQTGGTLTYKNEWMSDGKAERFVVKESGLELSRSIEDRRATQPEALTEFIRWGKQNAPADRYILVLWDHGFGVQGGFGRDELQDGKSMPVSDLQQAIIESETYFDIIAFDACLMGGVETLYALRDCGKYMIASQQTTPACGFYYTTWLESLRYNPTISTEQLGRVLLDSFTLHAGIESNLPTTIAMMKLDQAEVLVSELTKCLSQATTGETDKWKTAVQGATAMGGKNKKYDLFDVVQLLSESGSANRARGMAAVSAVAYELRNTVGVETLCGISMYLPRDLPLKADAVMQELRRIGLPTEYLDSIAKMH